MALITNTDTSTLPYNDNYMEYDLDRHMYVPTIEGINEYTGYNILTEAGNPTKADIARYRIATDLISYIKRYSRVTDINKKIFQIAKDSTIREYYKLALMEQALYYLESGAGALKTQHGVNIGTGKVIPIEQLRGQVLISPIAQDFLFQAGLTFSGYSSFISNYEEDGTW